MSKKKNPEKKKVHYTFHRLRYNNVKYTPLTSRWVSFRLCILLRSSTSGVLGSNASVLLPSTPPLAFAAYNRLENIPIYAVFAEISFSRERRDFFLIDRKVSGGNNETPYLLPEDTC